MGIIMGTHCYSHFFTIIIPIFFLNGNTEVGCLCYVRLKEDIIKTSHTLGDLFSFRSVCIYTPRICSGYILLKDTDVVVLEE